MKNDRAEIEWAHRVKLTKIRVLYLNDAQGMRDEDLIDEVGIGLLLRCQSIMEFTEAVEGRVKCMRCARTRNTTILERRTMEPDELLKCPVCSWQIRWRVYLAESNKAKGQLIAGHARAAFINYLKVYPNCRTPQEKMLAIDRLIHEFHWELGRNGKSPQAMRTACVNLLDGTATEVLALLDSLAYDADPASEMKTEREVWRSQKVIARVISKKGPGQS
jgi:hypothetical protein